MSEPSVPPEVAAALPAVRWSAVGPAELPARGSPSAPLRPLRRALARAQRPILLVNDADRVAVRDQAELVADLWEGAGQPPILVATGTHKAALGPMRDRLGGLPLELHDADDDGAHVELCPEARIDRRVARADLIVAFGSVEPHYFAGWAGAHKTASVGVLARASIEVNHRGALSRFAQPCALEGNPVFDGLVPVLEALEEDRRLLAVNHVLDARGAPLALGLGTWRGALQRCLSAARARFVRTVPAPVDVVVARVHGPFARSLYQADKGLKNQEAALRDGGHLILEAPCGDGVGPARFLELLRAAPDHAAAEGHVAQHGYVLGDHKAVRWRALEARGVRIHLAASGLPATAIEGAGITLHADLGAALAAVAAERGSAPGEGLVVEDAAVTVCEVVN